MHTDWNIRVVEALDWNVRGRRGPGLEPPGLQKDEEAAAAGKGKENMSKIKERWRGRTRKKRELVRGRRRRGRKSGKTHGTSREAGLHKEDWNNRGAEALDWNVRGRSNPGLERPGLQKEEGMATERSGEENMNKSKEQMGKDAMNKCPEAGGEGEEGEAAEHMEPGQEQPGKQRTRTGTSGGEAALDWSFRGSMRMRKLRQRKTARRA